MSEQQKPEVVRQTRMRVLAYRTPEEAVREYAGLDRTLKEQMARVYQDAFGGSPWYEKCSCPSCGTFEKESTCSRCGSSDLPPAYPIGELVGQEFPSMLASFSPGVLVLAQNRDKGIMGFCAGGITTPKDLVVKKYKGNLAIAESIMRETGLTDTDEFFYENEMCVVPELQGNGLGSQLNKTRLDWITSEGIGAVLGRTINPNLLKMKAAQFPQRGFEMRVFTPEGDTYAVDGLQRQCYFAARVR